MNSKNLFRLSGLSGYISAALLLAFGAAWLLLPQPDMTQSEILALSGAVAHVFFAFALTGMYLIQHQESGVLGLVAYFVSTMGNIFFTSAQFISAYFLLTGGLIPLVNLLPLGLLLFAIANQRAKVLPATGAWLMFLGQFANGLLSQIWPDLPILVQITIFAAGITLMSSALRKKVS